MLGRATAGADGKDELRGRRAREEASDLTVGRAANTRLLAPGAPLLRRPVAKPARELGCQLGPQVP